MDFETAVGAISTLGFPTICALILFIYVKYLTDQHTVEIKNLCEQMNRNNDSLRQAIEAQTMTQTRIFDILERIDKQGVRVDDG